jgi:hypothetical protein
MSVFISYSHVDVDIADKIANILDELGIEYYLDKKNIKWGQVIDESVSSGLLACKYLIVLISPASHQSDWVPYEVGQAKAHVKKVLPFLVHPSVDIPSYLSNLHCISSLGKIREFFSNINPLYLDNRLPHNVSMEDLFEGLISILCPKGWHRAILSGKKDYKRIQYCPATVGFAQGLAGMPAIYRKYISLEKGRYIEFMYDFKEKEKIPKVGYAEFGPEESTISIYVEPVDAKEFKKSWEYIGPNPLLNVMEKENIIYAVLDDYFIDDLKSIKPNKHSLREEDLPFKIVSQAEYVSSEIAQRKGFTLALTK